MPIKSEGFQNAGARDKAVVDQVSGFECHYALAANKDDDHPIQQDRASVVEITPHASQFNEVMEESFEAMRKKSMSVIRAEAHRPKKDKFNGGACATLTLFDPLHFKLKIGSKGDCPVFLVLRHNNEVKVIRISSPKTTFFAEFPANPGEDVEVLNNIAARFPWMNASHGGEKGSDTIIDLKKLVQSEYESKWGTIPGESWQHHLPPGVEVSLIAASDAVSKIPDLTKALERVFTLADAAKAKGREYNIAHALNEEAKLQGVADNFSAVILRDIKYEPHHSSVAIGICDGHYKDGHYIADAGMRAFENVMEKYRDAPGHHPQHHASKAVGKPRTPPS